MGTNDTSESVMYPELPATPGPLRNCGSSRGPAGDPATKSDSVLLAARGETVADVNVVIRQLGAAKQRAEARLREIEATLQSIADSAPVLIWTAGTDKKCNYFNQPWLAFTGRTMAEELGDGWTEGVHPDDLPRVLAKWKYAVETGQPHESEHRVRRADGVYRWFQSRALPLRDDEGRIVRWYNLRTDIDDRKNAEEKLRRSEASLLDAQRLSRTGSWNHDLSSGTACRAERPV